MIVWLQQSSCRYLRIYVSLHRRSERSKRMTPSVPSTMPAGAPSKTPLQLQVPQGTSQILSGNGSTNRIAFNENVSTSCPKSLPVVQRTMGYAPSENQLDQTPVQRPVLSKTFAWYEFPLSRKGRCSCSVSRIVHKRATMHQKTHFWKLPVSASRKSADKRIISKIN